jgi:xanthine/uracil permease
MWQEYKRRFWMSQFLIVLAVIVTWQVAKFPWQQIVMIIIAMEIGSLLGAAMGAKIKREVRHSNDDLPLKPQ